jgi:hypothetical protein
MEIRTVSPLHGSTARTGVEAENESTGHPDARSSKRRLANVEAASQPVFADFLDVLPAIVFTR